MKTLGKLGLSMIVFLGGTALLVINREVIGAGGLVNFILYVAMVGGIAAVWRKNKQ
jgi:hypothetical protein